MWIVVHVEEDSKVGEMGTIAYYVDVSTLVRNDFGFVTTLFGPDAQFTSNCAENSQKLTNFINYPKFR